MASSYTDLGTELMTTGENAGTWGSTTNTNLQILEEAIRGYVAVSANSDQTLSLTDGSTGDSIRNSVIAFTGTLSANRTITVPSAEKWWIMDNQTAGAYTLTVKVSGQTGITWGASDKGTKILYSNGTDVVDTNVGGGVGAYDLNGNELTLDADSDTSITASTDDQIDIEIAGADDFTFTANAFNVLTGSHATFADSANAKFGTGNDMLVYHDGSNSYITNSQGALKVATETSGIAITLGHSTSEVTVADNLTVTGTLTGTLATAAQGTVTSLGTLTTLTVDNVITNGATIGHTSDTDLMTLADGVLTVAGELDATTLDISGNADIDGTLEADAITINGTAIGSIYGVVAGSSSIVTTGALDSGSITSGFGTIDTGSSTITTTGLITGGSLDIDNVLINGTTIGHTDDTDLITLADGVATIAGELDATTLDISGNADIDGTTNLDAVDIDGAVQLDSTLTVGVNDTGYDVKFFGATSGAYMLWDESTDDLVLAGASKLYLYDAAGGEYLSSSGSALTIASGSAAWELPASDGSANQVLKTDGSGNLDWTSITSATITALNNATANELVTVGSTTTELDAEANLTFDGTTLTTTALAVDDVAVDGKVVTMTGSTSDTAVFTAGTNGTLSIVTTDDAAAAANMTLTADGTFEADGTTVTLDSAGDVVLDAGGADVFLKDDGTLFGTFTNSGGELVVKSSSSGTTALTFSGANATFAGTLATAAGGFNIAGLDIDGATDIGEAVVDADLFIVDNGAGGTNRKVAASRIVTYIDANSSAASTGKAIAMALVFG